MEWLPTPLLLKLRSASRPITSRQTDGVKMETMADFVVMGSKIIVDGDCSHEIKRRLFAPWKKSYEKPRQHMKKQRQHFADHRPYS